MAEAQACTCHTGFTGSQGEDHMLLPTSLMWAAQRPLTWLWQPSSPWSTTSEWQPGHPHAQLVGFPSWAYPQSQQLLENTPGPHTSVAPSFWAMEQRALDRLSSPAGLRKPRAGDGAFWPSQVTQAQPLPCRILA